MDDHKTEVVEKRLNRGVIRRRSSTVDEKPEAKKAAVPAQPAEAVKPKEAASAPESIPTPVVTAKPAVPAPKEVAIPVKAKTEPVAKTQDVVQAPSPIVPEIKPEESLEKKPVV